MKSKKLNTVIFVLAGTIANVLLAFVFIALLLLLVSQFSSVLHERVASLLPFAFIGGIIIAMIVYQRLTKWVVERFNLTDKLDPLFFKSKKNPENANRS